MFHAEHFGDYSQDSRQVSILGLMPLGMHLEAGPNSLRYSSVPGGTLSHLCGGLFVIPPRLLGETFHVEHRAPAKTVVRRLEEVSKCST